MSKGSTDPGLRMILEIDELDQDKPQTYEMDEEEFYAPEEFIRGFDPDFIAKSGLAIGGEYSFLLPGKDGAPTWRRVRITGVFFDGYAIIDLDKDPNI